MFAISSRQGMVLGSRNLSLCDMDRYVVCSMNGESPKILPGKGGKETGPLDIDDAKQLLKFYKDNLKRDDVGIYPIELGDKVDPVS